MKMEYCNAFDSFGFCCEKAGKVVARREPKRLKRFVNGNEQTNEATHFWSSRMSMAVNSCRVDEKRLNIHQVLARNLLPVFHNTKF